MSDVNKQDELEGLAAIGGCGLVVIVAVILVIILSFINMALMELFWRFIVANILSGMVKAELIPAVLTFNQLLAIELFLMGRNVIYSGIKLALKAAEDL